MDKNKMRKIVFYNSKGGTGKTTICFNYGWYLSEMKDKKILFLDFDPQINLVQSFGLGTENKEKKNLDRMLTDHIKGRKIRLKDYVIEVNDRIHLLPSSNNISLAEEYLTDTLMKKSDKFSARSGSSHRDILLKNLIKDTVDHTDYDYVLIDSPSNFSLLSSVSLIYAMNIIIIIRPDFYSFQDIDYLKKIIKHLNKKYYVNIKINCILVNGYEKRKMTSKDGLMSITNKYSKEFDIIKKRIRYLSAFQSSISIEKKPVFLSYPRSEAAKNILDVFSELYDHVNIIKNN